MKGTTSKYSIAIFFFINIFSFLGFPVLFFSFKSLFLSLLFPDLSYVLFNINVFGFKQTTKKQNCLVKRGVATKRFFYEPVFCKMSKVIVFGAILGALFG